ncbi:DUF4139 domain-containing protein [Bartonella sp. HY038]|uniref:DUF4139 domain-containing protein n=1 Tax=Bartonella sp. HY038 TaxID=2759660 RepID=UPI0015F7B6E2|nr:DUF4139 domain-containing protein [Bartonella sp. HY038]
MKKAAWLFLNSLIFCFTSITQSFAQDQNAQVSTSDAGKDIAITIYNEDLALVREVRDLDLQKGVNHFALRDVSGMIKPETAIMTTKDNAKLYVIEQNFNFDLLTPDALTAKYVGKEVTIVRLNQDGSENSEKAVLLSNNSGLVLKYNDRIEIGLSKDARIKFDALPQNLRDRPTLVTDIMSEETGNKEVNIAYLSGGFSWKADYVAELNKDENRISLKGWVTLQNNSGTSYKDAKLQLVAGDVNKVVPLNQSVDGQMEVLMTIAGPSKIEEESLLDYHLYILPHATTLNNNQIKQVALMSADEVPVKKRYISDILKVFDDRKQNFINGDGKPYEVGVYFNLINNKESNLGIPIPKGNVRAFKADSQGNALFIGEDSIKHTANNEKISMKFGNAFDVNLYAKSLEVKKIGTNSNDDSIYEYTNQVIIKNAKREAVEVEIPVFFYGKWKILEENFSHEKQNSEIGLWKIKVQPESNEKLIYKVRIR